MAEKECQYGCGRMIPDAPGSTCCMVCAFKPKSRPRPEDRLGVGVKRG